MERDDCLLPEATRQTRIIRVQFRKRQSLFIKTNFKRFSRCVLKGMHLHVTLYVDKSTYMAVLTEACAFVFFWGGANVCRCVWTES